MFKQAEEIQTFNFDPSWMLTEENDFTVIGQYRIIQMIGKGAFSKVYTGQSLVSGQLFALKILRKQCLTYDSMTLFERELQTLTSITRHKNVLNIIDAFEVEEMFVLVTELCDGGDLLQIIRSKGQLSVIECRFIMKELLEGLLHIHKNHFISHRDLKLENVFLTLDGRVVLGDFGFSKEYSSSLWTRCGSEEYSAPEKLVGKSAYSPEKVDVWSFGVIFYACLKAKLPFNRSNKICGNSDHPFSLYSQILYKKVEIEEFPHECQEVLSRALEKDPNKRASLIELSLMRFFIN